MCTDPLVLIVMDLKFCDKIDSFQIAQQSSNKTKQKGVFFCVAILRKQVKQTTWCEYLFRRSATSTGDWLQ